MSMIPFASKYATSNIMEPLTIKSVTCSPPCLANLEGNQLKVRRLALIKGQNISCFSLQLQSKRQIVWRSWWQIFSNIHSPMYLAFYTASHIAFWMIWLRTICYQNKPRKRRQRITLWKKPAAFPFTNIDEEIQKFNDSNPFLAFRFQDHPSHQLVQKILVDMVIHLTVSNLKITPGVLFLTVEFTFSSPTNNAHIICLSAKILLRDFDMISH